MEGESTGMMQGDDPESSGETTDAEVPSPIVWENVPPGAFERAIATDANGRIYVATSSTDSEPVESSLLLAYDADGALLWQTSTPSYGSSGDVALAVDD